MLTRVFKLITLFPVV